MGPRACYDEGKRCAETLFFDYHRQHNLEDPGRAHLQYLWAKNAPERWTGDFEFHHTGPENEPITIYGDGSQTSSFCFVDDLIEGVVLLMNTSPDLAEPVNLGNPTEIKIKEVAEADHILNRFTVPALSIGRCLKMTRSSAAPISAVHARSSIGAARPAQKRIGTHDRVF